MAIMSVQRENCALRRGSRPRRQLLLAVFLGLLILCSGSQIARAQFTRFQTLTDEQGLGNLTVDSLAQDRAGYILLGTEAGLYRYDGVSLALYDAGLPSAAWIQQVVTDDAGRVWVVTTNGLYMRNGSTFSRVDTGTTSLYLKSPHFLAVAGGSVVLDVAGTLLRAQVVGSAAGKFSPLFDAATLARTPGLATARFVGPGSDGTLLIGCGVTICRMEAGRVTVLGEVDGLPPDAWQVTLQTPDGTLWARSLNHIAWRKPGHARFTVATLPGQDGSPGVPTLGEHTSYVANPERLDLLDDQHGGVLTQSAGGLVDWNGATWHAYPHHPGGLPADRIQALMFDREGSLWIGSFGAGAFRSIGLGDWEHWTADDGLPSKIVWSMTRLPNRQFWVATDSGTVALDGTLPGIPAGTNYVAKTTRRGRLWMAPIGTELIRRDPARGVVERFPSIGKVVTAEVDRNNRLWLGTSSGLFMMADADAAAPEARAKLVLAHDTTLVTTDPAGVVWMLSPDGVFRRNVAGHFDLIVPPALLKSGPIALTFSGESDFWIGTNSDGVLRFRMTGAHVEQLTSLVAPVIGSNNILFAHRDHRGWIWLGTDHGIDRFDGKSWRHFDSSGGPITNDINQAAVYEDVDGSMWFGTSHGLSHLLDPTRRPPQTVLHPLVTGLSLGDRIMPVSPSIQVDWSTAPLVVRFVDLDYTHGRNIVFRYWLRGLDAGWSTTTEHEVRYADLPAGRLRFELVAADTVQGSVSVPVGFTIYIRAPWWRRWWFYGLCALAITAVLVGTWQARVRMLLHNQRRLEKMVSERTAEIEHAKITLELAKATLEHQANDLQQQSKKLEGQALSMQRMAMSDALTGLPNRRAIMDVLDEGVVVALRSEETLAVLLCDIDHFKRINDGFGHLAGDEVLTVFGARLGASIGASETVGRYGGEEFLVILQGDPDVIVQRVAVIHSAITDAPYRVGDADQTVTSSGGLAFLRAGDTALSLLGRADVALYQAKENGRNRIEEERSELMGGQRTPLAATGVGAAAGLAPQDLRAALANNEFVLHYQPIVDMDKDVVTACEALLRWQSPSRGTVPPGDFIPFAEEAGLMPEIGDWVLRTACREAAAWREPVKIAVNLSPRQFRLPDLVDRVAAVLAEVGLPPERLELEVTETAMIDDMAAANVMLQQLRALGITIALDDFGTGYSSLNFLRTLPFDRSFVQDLGVKPEASTIVRGLIALCAGLGVAATAEGVESDQQIELLRAEGCSEVQGFRIGHPRPASEMQAWMAAFAASRSEARRAVLSELAPGFRSGL